MISLIIYRNLIIYLGFRKKRAKHFIAKALSNAELIGRYCSILAAGTLILISAREGDISKVFRAVGTHNIDCD